MEGKRENILIILLSYVSNYCINLNLKSSFVLINISYIIDNGLKVFQLQIRSIGKGLFWPFFSTIVGLRKGIRGVIFQS